MSKKIIYFTCLVPLLLVLCLGMFIGGQLIWRFIRPQPSSVTETLFNGVTYSRQVRNSPRPMVIHVVTVNLGESGVDVLVTPGDPDEDLPLEARTTSQFLAEFDLQVAINGKYAYHKREPVSPDAVRQKEFDAAFRFAAKYAGTHVDPATAPGAWIAFRENNVTREENGIPRKRRTLDRLTSDYTFLMHRLPDNSAGLGVVNLGPDEQRFGAWARRLPPRETMRLKADASFLESLKRSRANVRVIYLDEDGAFKLQAAGREWDVPLKKSGRWKIFNVTVDGAAMAKDNPIRLTAADRFVHFHMLEIERMR